MSYEPQFQITAHLLSIIEEISALREKIQAATVEVPWILSLQKETQIRNTHSSTAIEGNPLTLAEVKQIADGKDLPTATERSKREILNHFAALHFVEKHVFKKTIMSQDLFRLHTLVAKGVMDQGQPGEYRHMRVRVGHYIPPDPKAIPGLMKDYLEWWNRFSQKWSPVVSSAVLHFRFEEIHPFADGNGRLGRAIALWELYRRGFDTHHIFSVDEVYWENRPRYYQALSLVQQEKGDLTGWLEYSAEAIHLTLEKVWKRIAHLSLKTGDKITLRPKQEKLLLLLREKRAVSPKEIRDALHVSKQGAMDLLHPLMKAGLIRKEGTKKSGKYLLLT